MTQSTLVLVVSLGIAGSAHAGTCTPQAVQRATELYNAGAARFRLGQLSEAAEAFKQSYEACQSPKLLYNIGQTYRLAKDDDKALFFYKQYLAAAPTDDPDRGDAQERIRQIQERVSEKSRAPQHAEPTAPPSATPGREPVPSLVSAAPSRERRRRRRWVLPVVIVGGVAAAGLAVGLGVGLSQSMKYPAASPSNGTFQF